MPTFRNTRISARISNTTSSELERYVDARGLKKSHVIEQALRHHLRALRELPADVIIPPQLVVSAKVAMRMATRMEKPRKPTDAMCAVFGNK